MIWKGFRFALAIISGKFIFNFGIAERLRTLRYPIFTEGGVEENCLSTVALFPMKKSKGAANAISVYDPFPVKK